MNASRPCAGRLPQEVGGGTRQEQLALGETPNLAARLQGIAAQHEPPNVEQAAAHYCQALTLAEELGMRPLQAHCHHGLGTLYATIDQREQAHAELSTAMAFYRAMDMTFWLPQTEATLGRMQE
jgi:hypothetical protein